MTQTNTITSIKREFNLLPNIVGIITDANLSTITEQNYWINESNNVEELNNGEWQWQAEDLVLIYYSSSQIGFFTFDAINQTFVALSSSSSSGGIPENLFYICNDGNDSTGLMTRKFLTFSGMSSALRAIPDQQFVVFDVRGGADESLVPFVPPFNCAVYGFGMIFKIGTPALTGWSGANRNQILVGYNFDTGGTNLNFIFDGMDQSFNYLLQFINCGGLNDGTFTFSGFTGNLIDGKTPKIVFENFDSGASTIFSGQFSLSQNGSIEIEAGGNFKSITQQFEIDGGSSVLETDALISDSVSISLVGVFNNGGTTFLHKNLSSGYITPYTVNNSNTGTWTNASIDFTAESFPVSNLALLGSGVINIAPLSRQDGISLNISSTYYVSNENSTDDTTFQNIGQLTKPFQTVKKAIDYINNVVGVDTPGVNIVVLGNSDGDFDNDILIAPFINIIVQGNVWPVKTIGLDPALWTGSSELYASVICVDGGSMIISNSCGFTQSTNTNPDSKVIFAPNFTTDQGAITFTISGASESYDLTNGKWGDPLMGTNVTLAVNQAVNVFISGFLPIFFCTGTGYINMTVAGIPLAGPQYFTSTVASNIYFTSSVRSSFELGDNINLYLTSQSSPNNSGVTFLGAGSSVIQLSSSDAIVPQNTPENYVPSVSSGFPRSVTNDLVGIDNQFPIVSTLTTNTVIANTGGTVPGSKKTYYLNSTGSNTVTMPSVPIDGEEFEFFNLNASSGAFVVSIPNGINLAGIQFYGTTTSGVTSDVAIAQYVNISTSTTSFAITDFTKNGQHLTLKWSAAFGGWLIGSNFGYSI